MKKKKKRESWLLLMLIFFNQILVFVCNLGSFNIDTIDLFAICCIFGSGSSSINSSGSSSIQIRQGQRRHITQAPTKSCVVARRSNTIAFFVLFLISKR